MADKVTLVFVARVTLYTVIIVGAVLGVDALALSQLNLLMNVGVWFALLLVEGIEMGWVGMLGLRRRKGIKTRSDRRDPWDYTFPFPFPPRNMTCSYGNNTSPSRETRTYPSAFWLSLILAGLALLMLSFYLLSQLLTSYLQVDR
jgi:hypothetical protein